MIKPKSEVEPTETYDINGRFDIVEIDKLNYIYTQSENNTLRRHAIDSKVKVDYADNRLGKIDDLDPFDPFNILVFYRSYGIAKIMDNTLNVILVINFRDASPFQNITHMCSSNDGKYWIFEESMQKILKIDAGFIRLAETNRFSDLGIDSPQILRMRESNNQLFVLVKDTGVLVFDNFGQFLRKVVVPPVADFSVIDGKLFYTYSGILYSVEGLDTRKVELDNPKNPAGQFITAKLNKQNAVIWYAEGVDVQALNR